MKHLSLLAFCFFFFACEDPDPYKDPDKLVLPPITMEGKGTFGCKVNGEVWLPFIESPSILDKVISKTVELPSIGIQANLRKDKDKIWQHIFIGCTAVDTGSYQIPPPPWTGIVFVDYNLLSSCTGYKVNTIDSQIKILRLDLERRIVSGTFEYKNVRNVCTGDTVQITDGRFDLKY